MPFLTGINAWSCWVPRTVSAVANRLDKKQTLFFFVLMFCHKIKIEVVYTRLSPFIQLVRCHYLVIHGRSKLAYAASLFRVPPIPSQALFPWDVSKKCLSAGTPKSSLWHVIFGKFFLFLYWAADISEK
jgi:hypothetical protein